MDVAYFQVWYFYTGIYRYCDRHPLNPVCKEGMRKAIAAGRNGHTTLLEAKHMEVPKASKSVPETS